VCNAKRAVEKFRGLNEGAEAAGEKTNQNLQEEYNGWLSTAR
jgi:hypothetical protein